MSVVVGPNIDFAKIEALFMDVDGVMTDGRILLGGDGVSRRSYYARDGIGLQLCRRAGIKLAMITSSSSKGVILRGEKLGIDLVCTGVKDKAEELRIRAQALEIDPAAVAFMGDDLVDIPALKIAGLAIAVADADPSVLACADMITIRAGGMGAVREVCEMLVSARDPELLRRIRECGLFL